MVVAALPRHHPRLVEDLLEALPPIVPIDLGALAALMIAATAADALLVEDNGRLGIGRIEATDTILHRRFSAFSLRLWIGRGSGLQIGRAHVWTPVTNAQIVCRLLLE